MAEQAAQEVKQVSKWKPAERSLNEILTDLRKPISAEHLKQKQAGKSQVTYLPWYTAIRYLDFYAPGWQYEITEISHYPTGNSGGKIAVKVRISIPTSDGVFYRESIGNEDDDKEGYGDPFSNSESQALRRAAAKFGLGLYLYDRK
jgi:hypothetical protein